MAVSFRLVKNGQQSALQSTAAANKQDAVIRSQYKPSGNVPNNYDYDQIPVEVDGEKVVAANFRDTHRAWPFVPILSDEPEPDKKDETEAVQAKSLEDDLCVWFGHDMPTVYDDQRPERDLVNYPREPPRLEHQPPTRMIFLPESYFKFFYEKTGVTGPYLFMGSFGTFLLSKEQFVLAEDAYNGLVLCIIIGAVATKFGPQLNQSLTGVEIVSVKITISHFGFCTCLIVFLTLIVSFFQQKHNQGWVDWQAGMIKFLDDYIQKYKDVQTLSVDQGILFQAKRENVALQREAEYRRRLMTVYSETKRKLDYHVAVEAAQKQFSKAHLVNWVINNVNKGITPELQATVLQQSLSDLKALSQKRKNAI